MPRTCSKLGVSNAVERATHSPTGIGKEIPEIACVKAGAVSTRSRGRSGESWSRVHFNAHLTLFRTARVGPFRALEAGFVA